MALERLLKCASHCIPEPDCLIVRSGREPLAVRREGDGSDGAAMALECLLKCASRRIPEPDCPIVTKRTQASDRLARRRRL